MAGGGSSVHLLGLFTGTFIRIATVRTRRVALRVRQEEVLQRRLAGMEVGDGDAGVL